MRAGTPPPSRSAAGAVPTMPYRRAERAPHHRRTQTTVMPAAAPIRPVIAPLSHSIGGATTL